MREARPRAAARGRVIAHAHVTIPAEEKGKAIGKGGRNIQLARMLMKRHHAVADVSLG